MKSLYFTRLALLLIVNFSALSLSSCEKGDSNSDSLFSSNKICYIHSVDIAGIENNAQYYSEIDQAVSNNEVLATTYLDRLHSYKTYATRDMFICGGVFCTVYPTKYGRFEDVIQSNAEGYQIVNSNTIADIDCVLLVDEEDRKEYSEYTQFKTVYRGTNFKSISWYVRVIYYTYVKSNGKLVLSNGKIFTESNDILIPDGSSQRYVKYDLNSLK